MKDFFYITFVFVKFGQEVLPEGALLEARAHACARSLLRVQDDVFLAVWGPHRPDGRGHGAVRSLVGVPGKEMVGIMLNEATSDPQIK